MGESIRKHNNHRSFALHECPLIAGDENADLLLDYTNRKLDPELTEVFERHMAMCAACQAFVEAQSSVWRALDAFEAMPVSDDFDQKLWAKIEREERRSWWWRALNFVSSGPFWKPVIPLAAMALIAVGLWMKPGTPMAEPLQKAVVKMDVEQIETALDDIEMLQVLSAAESVNPRQM